MRSSGATRLLAVSLSAALLLGATSATAQASFAPDVSVSLPGVVANDEDVVVPSGGSFTLAGDLPSLPSNVELSALTRDGTDVLFSLDVTAVVEGVTLEPRDIARWDGATLVLEIDGSADGIPDGVGIDALLLSSGGNPFLSIDTSAKVGALDIDDEDLFRLLPTPFLFFDGSAEGIDPGLDLVGASLVTSTSGLLSFDGSGSVGGIDFDDEDMLGWDQITGDFSLVFDGSASDPALVRTGVVALPEPGFGVAMAAGLACLALLCRRR